MGTNNESESTCWQDITQEFLSSVKQLNLGELLKTDQFTLQIAMSAIQLMDPKMDTGMMFLKSKRRVLTLEQSIKAGLVKMNNLEKEEIIGIIDDSYACLVTWLDGHPLSQTVMTNLYLQDTERIEDRCLRVFCQAMLKIVDFLDRIVSMVLCIEEEDFFLNYGKFNLATQINEQKVLNALEDLCLQYEGQSSDKKTKQNNNSTTTNHNDQQSNDCEANEKNNVIKPPMSEEEIKKTNALASRLRFTHNFYAFLLNVSKHLLKSYTIWGPDEDAVIKKTVKMHLGHVSNCDQSLEKCTGYLERWSETIDAGIKPINENVRASSDGDYPTIMGFEPFTNHKSQTADFPRCPSIKTRPMTVKYLKDLITKLRKCITLSSNFHHKSFNRSLEAIEHLSKHHRPKSCVISRSFMLILYLPYRISTMLKEELNQSMHEYCEPGMHVLKKDTEKMAAMNEFLNESLKVFGNVINIYGHNPARQYEKFFDIILHSKTLQYSAYLVNDILKNNLVYSWTTYYFSKFCIKYVLAGLELELFSSHEFPYVFWFLYEILYRNEKEQLEIAKRLLCETQFALDQEQASKQGNKSKGNSKKNMRKIQMSTSFHNKNLLLNDALRFLTGGMFLLTYGLKLQGKIRSPSFEFTSEEICFDHRFGSMTGSSVYHAYKYTLSRLGNLDSIYKEAFECFSEARQLFEKYGEGQEECLIICKTNMVVAKILSSNSNSFADREVEFCFDRHPSFPTIKL